MNCEKNFLLLSKRLNNIYNQNVNEHEVTIGEYFCEDNYDYLKMSFKLKEYKKNELFDVTNFNAIVNFKAKCIDVEAYDSISYDEYALDDYGEEILNILGNIYFN